MRVLVTMHQYHPDTPSGASRLAFDEARYLASLGHEVWIVSQDLTRRRPEYFRDGQVHSLCYARPSMRRLDPRRLSFHRRAARRLLERYLLPDGVDAIHGHSLLEYQAAVNTLGSRAFKTYSVHSPVRPEQRAEARGGRAVDRAWLALRGEVWHRLERRMVMLSDCVTAESEFTRSLLVTLYGPDAARNTVVIPGWVDLGRFQILDDRKAAKRMLGWPADVPVLFTLRRLVPRMGLDRLLVAARHLEETGRRFHIVVAGAGDLRPALEEMADAFGLAKTTRFIGRVSDDLLPTMYAAADAFVLPTAELECFGLIALEALACGRPVLATPVGAIPEVIGPLEPAWLASGNSAADIAGLVGRFLDGQLPVHDPAELREKVRTKYSQELVMRRVIEAAILPASGRSSPAAAWSHRN
ncbi:MAG: glycosyltransferase family 4 protein [Vicinamibacterales bacterium]